jgi:hypothetical protein
MIRVPRIAGTAVFLAAWLTSGSRLKFFVHYRDLIQIRHA